MVPQSPVPQFSPQTTLADLPSHNYRVAPATLTQEVAGQLERNGDWPGVIIAEGASVFGAISREVFFRRMSHQFSLEIYARRPIIVLLKSIVLATLRLPSTLEVAAAAEMLLRRDHSQLSEPLLVEYAGGDCRLL